MEIIPAIDIKGGRCVRLYQGDFYREVVFSTDPLEIAIRWAKEGAPRLHIVDLDGAREGRPGNLSLVKKIVESISIPVQFGGGLRKIETIKEVFDIGVDRAILGTASILEPDLVSEAVRLFGERIAISLDVRRGYLLIKGWMERTKIKAERLISCLIEHGVRRFIYTDALKDGTLTAPNFRAIFRILPLAPHLIVGGGVSKLSQLKKLSRMGVEGVILGMALYKGEIDLKEALKIC